MAANTSPIYSIASDFQGGPLITTAATVVYDISGTIGTDIYKLFTASAEGSFIQRLRLKYAANATTTSVAAVLKLWISNVGTGTPTIGTQAWLYDEVALPATGALTTTAVNAGFDIPLNFPLPTGYFLLGKITVSQSANTGWLATVIAGKY